MTDLGSIGSGSVLVSYPPSSVAVISGVGPVPAKLVGPFVISNGKASSEQKPVGQVNISNVNPFMVHKSPIKGAGFLASIYTKRPKAEVHAIPKIWNGLNWEQLFRNEA